MARPSTKREPADYVGIVDLDPSPIDLLSRPSARLLMKLAARRWGVNAAMLPGPSRDSLLVVARHHAMWLIRTHTGMSLPGIGRMFGGRDHATVLSGIAHHLERVAGKRELPFVWTPQRASNVLRFARTGGTLQEIGRTFGLPRADLLRHPRYAELRDHARDHLTNRRILSALAMKSEARA